MNINSKFFESGCKVNAVATPGAVELHQPGPGAGADGWLEVGCVKQDYLVMFTVERGATQTVLQRGVGHKGEEQEEGEGGGGVHCCT